MKNARELWFRCKEDRRYFFREFLRIRTLENGQYRLLPLVLNREQGQILDAIEEMELDNKPVRIIIDKSRKVGVSTLIEAVAYHYCMFSRNAHAIVVAHLQGATERIFDITKRFHENMHPGLAAVAPAKDLKNLIKFNHGSNLEVMTQGSTDAARGSTPSFLHISELGLWDRHRSTTSAEDVLQSTFGSIEDQPGTTVIIESTANGPRGAFYDRWAAAVNDSPGNLFKPLFFGWQDHAAYRLEKLEGDDGILEQLKAAWDLGDQAFVDSILEELGFDHFWGDRMQEFNLEPCQVRWAHRTMATKFGGDIRRFDTEYPLSWQISFQSSGGSVFDMPEVATLLESVPKPTEKFEAFNEDGSIQRGGTSWHMFHPPEPGHEYLIGVDSAAGILEGDYSCAQVLDRTDQKQAAELYAKLPPDDLAEQVIRAGRLYNEALVVPEVDGPGLVLLRILLDHYPEVYRRSNSTAWAQAWGFKTTYQTRDAAITEFAGALRTGSWKFNSKRLLNECLTFVYDQSGKPAALPGSHDDAVMAMAIAIYVDKELGIPGFGGVVSPKVVYDRNSVARLLNVPPSDEHDPHLGSIC